jgi:hypothetical protein
VAHYVPKEGETVWDGKYLPDIYRPTKD